jgi:CRP-like cAMP-binding protein
LPLLVVPAWPVLRRIDRESVISVERLQRLGQVPFLSLLPESTLEQLAQAVVEEPMRAGEEVVRQGEPGDRFYVIDSGSVDVYVDGQPTTRLDPGEYFGEIALLRDTPRTATVSAREDGLLLTLSRDSFVPAVAGYAPSHRSAETVVGRRLGPARAGFVPP